jgi:hypothetical protein
MDTQYVFHSDPGHGWLEVSLKELEDLRIAHKISPFSYLHKGRVYLEEDCDMSIFAFAKGWKIGGNAPIKDVHYNNECPIRNYSSYHHPEYVEPHNFSLEELMDGLNDCEHQVIARSCTQCREGK